MAKKPQDNAPAIVRVKNIQVPLLAQYNGQEAKVEYCFAGLTGISASVICTNGQTLLLDPNEYDVISGALTPAPPNHGQNHHRAQNLRIAKANRRYIKRARRGPTQEY